MRQLQEQARIGNLKLVIESLPLETSAVTTAAPHLSSLSGVQFAVLLKELASDNHAFRYDCILQQTSRQKTVSPGFFLCFLWFPRCRITADLLRIGPLDDH